MKTDIEIASEAKLLPICEIADKLGLTEDEYDLYSEFIARVTDMVFDLGRTPIVWEGFPKKGSHRINRNTVVIAWESHYQLVTENIGAVFNSYSVLFDFFSET